MKGNIEIQSDDRRLVRFLARAFVMLNENQIGELLGRSRRALKMRLKRLVRAGILSERQGEGEAAESRVPLYFVGTGGEKLLEAEGEEWKVQGRGMQARKIGVGKLAHMRMVAWIQTKFRTAGREYDDYRFEAWIPEDGKVWEVLQGQGIGLRPDGYVRFMKGGKRFHVFVEADRGSYGGEELRRKFEKYWRYVSSSFAEKHFGAGEFRVILVTESEGRARELVRRAKRYARDIFWVCVMDDFKRNPLFHAHWRCGSWEVIGSLDEPTGPVPEPPVPPEARERLEPSVQSEDEVLSL